MTKNTIYISGPMTGYLEHNSPAFAAAAAELRHNGWIVVSPAEHPDAYADLSWEDHLRRDLRLLTECDAIYMLKGWPKSKGASLEHHVANALGMKIFSQYYGIYPEAPRRAA